MKKILFIATYGDFLATFEYSNISLLIEMGYEVHCASNFSIPSYNRKVDRLDKLNIKKHNIEFERSPFSINNIGIYKALVKLMKKEQFEMIDCHNAVVGVLARLAAKKSKIKRVIYTPHSFFFYEGCPLKNKLIFKNIESIFARFTDLLISINKEDYEASKKMKIRGKAVYIPGVGIDVNNIKCINSRRNEYCKEFNIPEDSIIFISVGELITRKNHITALRAFAKARINNAYYIICGFGELEKELKLEAEVLNIRDKVIFAGFRLDAKEIMKSSDVFVFPSYQEGLSVALMEAMACGLPCIVSNIRGNVDLIKNNQGGIIFKTENVEELAQKIEYIAKEVDIRERFGRYNLDIVSQYDINNVRVLMKKEYKKILNN